jgi:hypothetical protein
MCRLLGWLLTVGNGTPQSSADVSFEVSLVRRTFRMHVDADPRASCRPCGRCLRTPEHPWRHQRQGTFDWPSDASGAVAGQRVCRFWTARAVFDQPDWTRLYQQYTDTPGGTYWCTALADAGDHEPFAVAIETPYDHGGHHRDPQQVHNQLHDSREARSWPLVTAPFLETWSRVHQIGAGERLDLLPYPLEPAGVDDRFAHVGQCPPLLGLCGGRLAMQLDRKC